MPAEGAPREGGEFVAQPAKLLRIASMIRELPRGGAQVVPGRSRRSVCARSRQGDHRLEGRPLDDLQKELETLTIPLEGTPSESEIRLAPGLSWSAGWKGCFNGHPGGALAQHMQTRAQLDEMRRRGLAARPDGPGGPGGTGPYL